MDSWGGGREIPAAAMAFEIRDGSVALGQAEATHVRVGHSNGRPSTALQSLMEAAPGAEPVPSSEEVEPLLTYLSTAIADALAKLEPRERFVVEALVFERRSIRDVGDNLLSLSKSQVHRILHKALDKLRVVLEQDPLIFEHLSTPLSAVTTGDGFGE